MRLIVHIAKKEIIVAIREKRALTLASIILLLMAISLYTGYINVLQQQDTITKVAEEKRQEWLGQGEKHPHIAAHYGTFVFKPKTVLSLFDFGLDSFTGTSIYLEAHYQHEFLFRPAQDHTSMIRFGEMSSALVLQLLMPLLIIFLTFMSFTRERQSGTLKLLISQGVSYSMLIWGKVAAFFCLIMSILIPYAIGLILISYSGLINESIPDLGTRILFLMCIYGIYLLLFTAVSILVSFYASSGRSALLTSLTIWIFATILLPKIVSSVSDRLYEIPSMREFKAHIEQDKRNGLEGRLTRAERIVRLEKEYLDKYNVDSIQQLPVNFEGIKMQAGEEYGNEIYDHHLGELRQLFRKQSRLRSLAGFINPYLSVQHLSMAISGTDLATFTDFEVQAEDYRRQLIKKMNKDMADNSRYGEFYEYKAGDQLWQDIEDFDYQMPLLLKSLHTYWYDLVSLLLWLAVIITSLNFVGRQMKKHHE